jgi:hypothetical protein
MPESVTLEQVETLVVQLPPQDQLRLLAHISERLSSTLPTTPEAKSSPQDTVQDDRLQLVKMLCDEVDDVIDDAQGEFDAAEDIQRTREERVSQVWRNDA